MESHNHRLAIKFDGKNYFLWSSYMKNFLKGHDLWEYIDGSMSKSSEGSTASKWIVNNAKIKTWIMEFVKSSITANLSVHLRQPRRCGITYRKYTNKAIRLEFIR